MIVLDTVKIAFVVQTKGEEVTYLIRFFKNGVACGEFSNIADAKKELKSASSAEVNIKGDTTFSRLHDLVHQVNVLLDANCNYNDIKIITT